MPSPVERRHEVRTRHVLIFAAAVAAAVAALPPASVAGHFDCNLRLVGPNLDAGIYAFAYGEIVCDTAKNTIRLRTTMTRDGTTTDDVVVTCHKDVDCWNYLLENDSPGDQVWCATISARVGPHNVAPITRCATF
jgi:hypothetical protein